MTLPDFFMQIMIDLNASSYDEEMPHGVTRTKKQWVVANLEHLMKFSQSDPKYWPGMNSTARSLWSSSLPFLKKTGVLDQFEGDVALREKLKAFLVP